MDIIDEDCQLHTFFYIKLTRNVQEGNITKNLQKKNILKIRGKIGTNGKKKRKWVKKRAAYLLFFCMYFLFLF